MRTRVLGSFLVVALLLGGWLAVPAEAQPFSAQIQRALTVFVAAAHTWTATQTFQNITINGACTGCGGAANAVNDSQCFTIATPLACWTYGPGITSGGFAPALANALVLGHAGAITAVNRNQFILEGVSDGTSANTSWVEITAPHNASASVGIATIRARAGAFWDEEIVIEAQQQGVVAFGNETVQELVVVGTKDAPFGGGVIGGMNIRGDDAYCVSALSGGPRLDACTATFEYGGTNIAKIGDGTVSGYGSLDTQALRISGALLCGTTAPSVASGFGSGAAVVNPNGNCSFTVGVGTTSGSTGVLTLPTAPHGWNLTCHDITTHSATVFLTRQTATSTTSGTIGNFSTADVAGAWANNDVLSCVATPY